MFAEAESSRSMVVSSLARCMSLMDGAVCVRLLVLEMSSVGSEIWGRPLRVLELRVGMALARLRETTRIKPIVEDVDESV